MQKIKRHTFIKAIILIIFSCILIASFFFFAILGNKKDDNAGRSEESTQPPPKYADFPTVIIDAGHGGEDGGAIGTNGVFEKDLNLKIALELDEMLRALGVNTRLTRTEDILLYDRNSDYQGHKKSQDMAARLAITNEYEDAVFISIHMNSFPQEKYSGLQVYYSENSPTSYELAELIQSFTRQNLQPNNSRKIKASGGNIYLLEKITHPAILIECGFLTNTAECEKLCSGEYRSRLCMVICTAVINYFDTISNNPSEST